MQKKKMKSEFNLSTYFNVLEEFENFLDAYGTDSEDGRCVCCGMRVGLVGCAKLEPHAKSCEILRLKNGIKKERKRREKLLKEAAEELEKSVKLKVDARMRQLKEL